MPRGGLFSHRALDHSSHLPDHTVNVSVDTDVKDNKSLCQAIVKATGQMLGELSQQIVEFDDERKAADADSARRLIASTELIAKRMATVEKEILEGQCHSELMEHLNLLVQLTKEPKHAPVLEAIAALPFEQTDLSPVLSEIGLVHKRHSKLEEFLKGMQDSHSELRGKHGEVLKSQSELQELVLAMQDSHNALHNKHAKLLTNSSRQEEMLAQLYDGHNTLHDKYAELAGNHGHLKDILRSLHESQKQLHGRHDELLGVIEQNAMPDLGPFHKHFSMVGDALSTHSTQVTSIEQRLQMLEKSEQERTQILEAVLHRLPLDLDKQLKGMQADLRAVRSAVQQDLDQLADSLQSDLHGVHKEAQQARQEAASSAAAAERELRKLQQAVAQADAAAKQHRADMLSAVEQIEMGPGLEAITGGVADKLMKVSLRTDHSPILAALECVPDLHERMCHVHDKIGSSNVHYDPCEVLKAIGKIKNGPDHDRIADAVHERIANAILKVDHSDLTKALAKIDVEKALEAHSREVDAKLRRHTGDIMKAVSNGLDHQAIVDAMHERLQNSPLKVDHSELRQMIRRIPTEHDHDALASAVHNRMGSAIASAGNHSKILDAISGLKLEPDLSVMLEAIEAMEESVLSTLLEAIHNIDMQVSCRGALPSAMMPRLRDGSKSASKVHSEYKEKISQRPALGASSWAGQELNRSGDAQSQQTTPRSARETFLQLPSKSKMERSASTPRPAPSSTSPEHEVPASEGTLLACMCGYSCGTQSALNRHLQRLSGQRGHRAVGL